ncbi:MAG: beta-galactosidase GalB [Bacteroidales bacterium]|nr:beta-galactosidase GalB [Bacteroidales bacterium]
MFKNLKFLYFVPGVLLLFLCSYSSAAGETERGLFTRDWKFRQGDPEGVERVSLSTMRKWMAPTGDYLLDSIPGRNFPADSIVKYSFADPGFSDASWRGLDLPHDWGVESDFDINLNGGTGKLPFFGIGWYRKTFEIPAADKGKKIYLDIDGAMSYSLVWLNGKFVGGWPYGYASFRLDLTPYIKTGGKNVLAIRLDNPQNSSRWYPGGGLYRNIWLVKSDPVHIAQWGVTVTTPVATKESASVGVKVKVQNNLKSDVNVSVKTSVYAIDKTGNITGSPVAVKQTEVASVKAEKETAFNLALNIQKPALWDLANPNLYCAVSEIYQGKERVDRQETRFGVRTLVYDANKGFLLNGQRVQLNGVCNHHDMGALGSAIHVRALERQIEILQDMGCNAIRTSHNMPAPELVELCDKMGMLLMVESFDCWARGKTPEDYGQAFVDWHEKDMRAMVRHFRNNPSVIMWSIGNEIGEQGRPNEFYIAARLTEIAKSEDPTRPTTAGCNSPNAGFNGFGKNFDLMGYNYKPTVYERFHAEVPMQPVYGSETASCISSRGEYFFPVVNTKSQGKGNFQMSSYDLYAPAWATPPDVEFAAQDKNKFVFGEFVWTGFDYLGEPTPYSGDVTNLLNFTDPVERAKMQAQLDSIGKIRLPSRSSYFGFIDLAGFKKDGFYIYQARWRPNLPMAHILPHWNWAERVGQNTPVHVYTSGDEAELFLNGRSLGKRTKGEFEYRLRWDSVLYEPGELKVVAYKGGREWATETVKTTGAPSKLMMTPDRSVIQADGTDLSYVTVAIADKDGLTVPRSKNRVKFTISGPGEIVATDNGDATCLESFKSPQRNAFNGLCLAIIRTKRGETGEIRVTATSEGLSEASVVIRSEASKTSSGKAVR